MYGCLGFPDSVAFGLFLGKGSASFQFLVGKPGGPASTMLTGARAPAKVQPAAPCSLWVPGRIPPAESAIQSWACFARTQYLSVLVFLLKYNTVLLLIIICA